jgi:hypothetical protein
VTNTIGVTTIDAGDAFYRLTVAQRDEAWREVDELKRENERLRAALRELVALKVIKDDPWRTIPQAQDYRDRKPRAWAAARAALGENGND